MVRLVKEKHSLFFLAFPVVPAMSLAAVVPLRSILLLSLLEQV